jgi:cell division protein FtsA
MKDKERFIVTCDIGSCQMTLIGAHVSDGYNILGSTTIPNQSARNGHIQNLDQLIEVLHDGCDDLERQTGLPVTSIRATLPSSDFKSTLLREELCLKLGEVTAHDIEKLLNQMRLQKAYPTHDWVHLITPSFNLDEKTHIVNPLGLFGQKLLLTSHGIMAPLSDLKTLKRAFHRSGIKMESVSFQGLSAAHASLRSEETELGCLAIHFGASTTCFTKFELGQSVFSGQITSGSQHVTRDISVGLRTTLAEAERLKKLHGLCNSDNSFVPSNEIEHATIDVLDSQSSLERTVYKSSLKIIVESRIQEILNRIDKQLLSEKDRATGDMKKGIILTGGGSQLIGLVPFVEKHFGLPTRMGNVTSFRGVSDLFFDSTSHAAFGLLSHLFSGTHQEPIPQKRHPESKSFLKKWTSSVREKFLEET